MDIINIDLNSKDSEGKTLAHHLAEYGDFSLLKYLILFKSLNPFIKGNQGFLPKDIANNNRLGITAKHMKAIQEFLSSLTPENFEFHPKNPPTSITLTIDTRGFFMPTTSSSSKTDSSNEGSFTIAHRKNYLIELIEKDINEDINKFLKISIFYENYVFKKSPINFKDVCNAAIERDQPFYLLLILTYFDTTHPRRNTEILKATPIITAAYSKNLYPFAMLLTFKSTDELFIDYRIDMENVFDIANTLGESFFVFLIVMKKKF
ncbi:MAG: hypothetical protein AB2990_02385 [Candidatus Symbiodolus clandestinus]